MSDAVRPRKQLRMLVKGQNKINEFLQRRKKDKSQRERGSANIGEDYDKSDIEDDVPILSRIADPATDKARSLVVKLKVNFNTSNENAFPTSQESKISTLNTVDDDDGQDWDNSTALERDRMIKAARRKGVLGMEELESRMQVPFSSESVMARGRPIAKQPGTLQNTSVFTFNSAYPSSSNSGSAPSFGAQLTKVQPNRPQLEQAARNAFLKSRPEPDDVPDEELSPQKPGIAVRPQKLSTQHSLQAEGHPERRETLVKAASQLQNTKRLFDDLRLQGKVTEKSTKDGNAQPVFNISNFMRPKIAIPESGPELYRSFHHRPTVSKAVLPETHPDHIETGMFVEDAETGLTPAKKNENGDIPALTVETWTERVPIGVRHGKSTIKAPTAIVPGKPVTQASSNITSQLAQSTALPLTVPENFFTEPNRLLNAYLSSGNLKRKRLGDTTLPPPSRVHHHTASPNFNIFANGIVLYPELCLLLAAQLPVQTLINLYSISKDYHVILNQRFTTVILNQATKKAPAAARCYPWRCFAHLCQPDPAYISKVDSLNANLMARNGGTVVKPGIPPPAIHESTTLPGNNNPHSVNKRTINLAASKRRVPTFRWLHMAIHREKTMHEIYWLFAARGVPLPGDPSILHQGSFALSLHKLWFAMNIPDNSRRMAYFASHLLITPTDLSNILVFIVKLDMVCNDPLAGEKRDAVRKLFMSSPNGFDTLRSALKGEIWNDELEILRAWTRIGFQLDREDGQERAIGGGWVPLGLSEEDHAESDWIFGIPRDEVGLLKRQFWGKLDYDPATRMRKIPQYALPARGTIYLMRPDQIVLREAIRRGMRMGKQFLRGMLHGYIDEETLEAVPARDLNGGRSRVLEDEGEYKLDDVVGGMKALTVEDGGDPLLDLGDPWEGSPLTVKKTGASKQAVEARKREEKLLEDCMQAWTSEVDREERRKAYTGFSFIDE